jgi:L-asparaginase
VYFTCQRFRHENGLAPTERHGGTSERGLSTKSFLIIQTGGTIAGEVADPATGDGLGEPETLSRALEPIVRELWQDWKIEADTTTVEVARIDSSNILPDHWATIAGIVAEEYEKYAGFIVLHGTNTLAYTSAALAFSLPNLNKPVVLTGSQVPFGRASSDAPLNLANALRVAAYPHDGGLRGVVCVFGSYVIAGTRAKKTTEFALDAFVPFAGGQLGRIGRRIDMNRANVARHHEYLSDPAGAAVKRDDLVVRCDFDMRILSLTEFPGMDPRMLTEALTYLVSDERRAVRGVVIRAFGAGDVSHHLHPCLELLAEREVPVVVTTQAPQGVSSLRVNDPGRTLAARELAIPAHDMSIEAMTTKLGWLLAQSYSYDRIRREMERDLRGEITIRPDLR